MSTTPTNATPTNLARERGIREGLRLLTQCGIPCDLALAREMQDDCDEYTASPAYRARHSEQHSALPAPEAAAFPDALTGTPQWVGYAYPLIDGKRTKVPKNPHWHPGMSKAEREKTPQNASTTDPATWADFPTARAFALRHGYGLGFMLAPPFVGIDLDHCRDAATGELSTLAVSVLGELDTYAEVSVSGTGVKAIAYGEKPGTRCRRNGLEVEIYSEKRLFALTGERLAAAPMQINDCQDAVNHIYRATFGATAPAPTATPPAFVTTDDDRAVLDWLTTYNRKFPPLWDGNTSAYNGDQSAADQALCNMLAFRTGDENRVDSLFRQSGLYREKWERADYRHATITKAMQQRRFFTPGPTPSTLAAPHRPEADPLSELDRLCQENARLRDELAAEREHRAIVHRLMTTKGMTPVERVIAYGLVFEVASAASQGKRSDADPEAVPVNCTAMGENVGLKPQTISANITRFAERGQLRKVTTAKVARSGKTYNEIAVCLPGGSPLENLRAVATWRRPEGTKGVGGNGKRCSACGSDNVHREVRIVCGDCGHASKPLRVPPPLAAEETRGESWSAIMGVAPTPSTLEAPPPTTVPPVGPELSTLGATAGLSRNVAHQTVESPPFSSRYPQPEGTPSSVEAPQPVAGWAGTHPCGDCGATCYASAGVVPRCLPCRRVRDVGGDVAAGGG